VIDALVSLNNPKTDNPPKYAIANGLYIGELPAQFQDSTRTENTLLNLAQTNPYMMTIIGGYNRKMSAHTYSFTAEPTVPLQVH
jgi:hypothetical protein